MAAAAAIKDAQASQQSIYEYAPKSTAANDYMGLFLERSWKGAVAMSKKSFKNNPAMTLINEQQGSQSVVQHTAHENVQYDDHEDTQQLILNIRTQGRKGYKKPRINLAFDNEEFLNKIRAQANKNGMSITQFVNEAVAHYLTCAKPKRGGR